MDYRFILPLTATLGLSLGCDLGGQACTDIAVASVALEIVDAESGEPVDATVRYTIDGGEAQEPDEAFDDNIVLTYEQTGVFEVTVTADGYMDAVETYDVVLDEDGCHPVGVMDTIALQAE